MRVWIQCVSRYWELLFRNGDGLDIHRGGAKRVHVREEIVGVPPGSASSHGNGTESEERPQ